jgi:hypothetical protein
MGFIHFAHETFHHIHVYHPCFKCTTYVCKMYKLTKEWFSFDFHYEDCGMGCLWWLYHIIIMNMLKLFKRLLLKEHMLMQKNDYGKMPLRSECGNNTMELFQYCSWYSISFLFLLIFFWFHKSKSIQICGISCNYVNIM